VFIALAKRGSLTQVQKYAFSRDRQTFKHLTTQTTLDLLRRALLLS
jgi:nicotinamide mononucleotide (NMN) deamidase PncC